MLVQEFNARSRNIKIVFINQFGFTQKSCGKRMPEEMEFIDIRKGSDVEFGQSVYEPFGISQLEPLTFGGICVFSSVCGCSGLLRDVAGVQTPRNIIIADYTNLEGFEYADIEDLLQIDKSAREHIEASESQKVAKEIISATAAEAILKATTPSPKERWSSAEEFANALEGRQQDKIKMSFGAEPDATIALTQPPRDKVKTKAARIKKDK